MVHGHACSGCGAHFHIMELVVTDQVVPGKKGFWTGFPRPGRTVTVYRCTACRDLLFPPIDFSALGKSLQALRRPELPFLLAIGQEKGTA